jgi:hypothetical protein
MIERFQLFQAASSPIISFPTTRVLRLGIAQFGENNFFKKL